MNSEGKEKGRRGKQEGKRQKVKGRREKGEAVRLIAGMRIPRQSNGTADLARCPSPRLGEGPGMRDGAAPPAHRPSRVAPSGRVDGLSDINRVTGVERHTPPDRPADKSTGYSCEARLRGLVQPAQAGFAPLAHACTHRANHAHTRLFD